MKKLSTLLFVSLFALVACDKSHEHTTTSPASAVAVTNASSTQSEQSNLPPNAQTYRMAIDPTYPPFALKDEKGNAIGFDIDILKAIGEKQGFKVELIPHKWNTIFSDLSAGKYDIVGSGLSTLTNEPNVIATKPFIQSENVLISKSVAPIKTKQDIQGKKIGMTKESSGWAFVTPTLAKKEDVTEYKSTFLAFQGLIQGKVVGIADDGLVLKYLIKNSGIPSSDFYTLTEEQVFGSGNFTEDGIGFGVKKGNTELLNKLNTGIDQIKADGTYDKIVKKWFGDIQSSTTNPTASIAK